MANKRIRGDAKVSTVNKKMGIPIRNASGKRVRGDCRLKTLRKRK